MKRLLPSIVLLFLATVSSAALSPPTQLEVIDNPDDRGHALRVSWVSSVDDGTLVSSYSIWRAEGSPGDWTQVGSRAAAGKGGVGVSFVDVSESIHNGVEYFYRVDAIAEEDSSSAFSSEAAIAVAQWFNTNRLTMLVWVLIIGGAIVFWVQRSQRDGEIYLRPVAGLQAFDEAIGRATEMGQPVLFVPGIMDMDQIETLAGVSILGSVGKMTARYETPLEVPVSRSLVMAHSREVLRESYLGEGRPDLFHEDMVHYITDDQFAYAAAVDGIMLRQKPAACFYQGKFYAESLILAETGNSIGAIQIAGTASAAQLPFFITACDYTLIGEEFFAASAYLSGDRKFIGSIRGQDIGKFIFMAGLALGLVQMILGAAGVTLPPWLEVSRLFDVSGG